MVTAIRYHDISAGHRVYGHEGACAHLHGHNYRIYFTLASEEARPGELDSVGRVLDFSVIKSTLCQWLENNWDHKFLIWEKDPMAHELRMLDEDGVVFVPFNPTAENMAMYLVKNVAPYLLDGTDTQLISVRIEETRKCSVSYER